MTLWILFCKMTKDSDILFPLYARDRDDAERRAGEIVKERGYERLELRAVPYGFVMHHSRIAGTIEEGRA